MKKLIAFVSVVALSTSLFAAEGAAVYQAKCAGCHGSDGAKAIAAMGVTPINTPAVKAKGAAGINSIVERGQGKMPGFAGKLSHDERSAAAAYVLTLK